MSENDLLKPLTELHLYLAGHHSIECRCCQSSQKPAANGNGHKPALPLQMVVQAIDEALPLGLQKVRVCGGEPFLYPHWDALLDHLKNLTLRVVIETTGPGLTSQRAERLSRLARVEVVFGWVYSDPASRAANQPDPALEAIRQLAAAGIAPQIILTVTRGMLAQIPEMIRLAEQAGAKSIRFASPPPQINTAPTQANNGHGPPGAALTIEETIAIGLRVEREMAKSTRLRLSFDHPPTFRGLHPQASVEGQGYCPVLNRLSLLPDGTVVLCGAAESIPELAFGRLGSRTLEEIWRAEPMLLALRTGLPDRLEGICGHCVMKTACLGYCIAENYLRVGSFFGPNWFCQSAERVGLFPAGRIIENSW